MRSLAIGVPLLGAAVLSGASAAGERRARIGAIVVATVPLLLLVLAWTRFDTGPAAAAFQQIEEWPWIPSLGVAWRVGVDGIALAIAAMSALLFVFDIAFMLFFGAIRVLRVSPQMLESLFGGGE